MVFRNTSGYRHCFCLDPGVQEEVEQCCCRQRFRKIEKIVFDNIKNITFEARVTRQTALLTPLGSELPGPISEAFHGRENPVGKVLLLVLHLHNAFR